MSLLRSNNSLSVLLSSHEFMSDWIMYPDYIVSLLCLSKEILDIIVGKLFCHYIYNPNNTKVIKVLKIFMANMPNLLNINYCNSMVSVYTPIGNLIDFYVVYTIFYLDNCINSGGISKRTWWASKRILNILFYLDIKKNGAAILPRNSIIEIIEQLNMEKIFGSQKIRIIESSMYVIDDGYCIDSQFFNLEYLKTLSFYELIIYINLIKHNDCWILMVINCINDNIIIDKESGDHLLMLKCRSILNDVVFNKWRQLLSKYNVKKGVNSISVDTICNWIILHANIFYINTVTDRAIVRPSKFEYSVHITQAALLLNILIGKFKEPAEAYQYIETHILSKDKHVAISLFLLEIGDPVFKQKMLKIILSFMHHKCIEPTYFVAKITDLLSLTPGTNEHHTIVFRAKDNILYKSVIDIIFINEFNNNPETISAFMRDKNVQKTFYNNGIFHQYFNTLFYHLLPTNYRVLFTNCVSLNTFREMVEKSYDIDISNYLLMAWKSVQSNKTNVKFCAKIIFLWIINSLNLNLLNADNLFGNYRSSLISASFGYRPKTNSMYIREILGSKKEPIMALAQFLDQNADLKELLCKESKIEYQQLHSIFIESVKHSGLDLEMAQLKVNFLKIFNTDLTPMIKGFPGSKFTRLDDLVL